MASYNGRTHDWVLELHSLHSLDDPTVPASPNAEDDHVELTRRSTEITAAEAALPNRPRSRPASTCSEPLPGAAECLDFVKTRRGRFRPARQTRLRNNLLGAVGFLELANAGDCAANVWNETPVPTYALVLMALGGTLALCFIYFSVKDGRRSWANVRALREERRYLVSQRQLRLGDANMVRTIECFLDMNTRELGTELVDRIGMDTLLGFSALVVGTGTLMAMTGDHDSVLFTTSNLLTGYVGNMPCAIYGVANLLWSSYVWARARKQQRAALKYVRGSTRMSQMLRNRTSSIQLHAALNGITGIVAGAAALVTATMWWGYVVLVPCVVTSGIVNLFWRRRVGYERPLVVDQITSIDQDAVLEALRYANSCRERIVHGREAESRDPFTTLVSDTGSLLRALDVIRKNNLFEDYCLCLLQDKEILQRLQSGHSSTDDRPTVDWRQLLITEDEYWKTTLLKIARDLINKRALRSFVYQERHLLEVLGCYMCRGAEFGRKDESKKLTAAAQAHRNVHTYAGRHANDWLFGGFSMTGTMKALFRR